MELFGRLRDGWRKQRPPEPEVVRFEMTQTDPDFAHVREVQHDALNLIGAARNARQLAQRAADGQSIRREREFWSEHG